MSELAYISIFAALVLLLGILERIRLQRGLKKIPKRILVNGIRGKSTVTRLLMGILREENYKVAGKTTGTMPRLFYWDDKEEIEIIRSLQGPNISEQKWVVREVAKKGVDALVTECMAVNPEYQNTFQKRFVQSNITVITNIFEDHLDVMGPTLDQVAEAFSETIPRRGYVIMPPNPYESYFRKIADRRNTKVLIADPKSVTQQDLDRFSYMMFPENVAIGYVLADLWNIDRKQALRGMVHAPVDPGALIVKDFGDFRNPSYFFNGFAANDATSTINIWERILEEYPRLQQKVVIMNCREDRVDRTLQFAREVLPHLSVDQLVLTGKTVRPIVQAYDAGKIPAEKLVNFENKPGETVKDFLNNLPGGTMVFGIGNIHGGGEEIAQVVEELSRGESETSSENYPPGALKNEISRENRCKRSVTAHVRN